MIELSFEQSLLGVGLPSHRRPVNNYMGAFRVSTDAESPMFAFELRIMGALADFVRQRRIWLDWRAYPGAAAGYRFSEGNSHIHKETERGLPKTFTLHFIDMEDNVQQCGPTAIRPHHIIGLANDLKTLAPNLVVYNDSVHNLIENEILVRPQPRMPANEIPRSTPQ